MLTERRHQGLLFELGFQRGPNDWAHHDSSLATPEDVEISRRIYCGCYISDKQISLVLGRPLYLAYDDAEVQPAETPPFIASSRITDTGSRAE